MTRILALLCAAPLGALAATRTPPMTEDDK
jgi:hypothetical protein